MKLENVMEPSFMNAFYSPTLVAFRYGSEGIKLKIIKTHTMEFDTLDHVPRTITSKIMSQTKTNLTYNKATNKR